GAGAGVAHPLVRSGFPRDLARPRAAAVVRADRRAGRGVGGEHEDRRAAGRAAEGLFIYTAGATGFRGVLGRYLGAVGGSAAHAGAAAADPQGGSAPGGLPGECGAPEALTWRRPDLHEPRPNIDLRRERPMDRHLLAISSALSRCSSVRSPSRAISLSIRSSMPCRVSHSAQSSAWTREWRSRTVTPVSGHCFRRAYSAMVMEVQAPSAASNSS